MDWHKRALLMQLTQRQANLIFSNLPSEAIIAAKMIVMKSIEVIQEHPFFKTLRDGITSIASVLRTLPDPRAQAASSLLCDLPMLRIHASGAFVSTVLNSLLSGVWMLPLIHGNCS